MIKKLIGRFFLHVGICSIFIAYVIACPGAWGKLKNQSGEKNWRSFLNYWELEILREKERTHTHE